MKKAAKIILPILLAITIIFGIGWYLLEYDTEFTRDMLLRTARRFEANGKHETAEWFYDQAYSQADDNDAVAIELANQHKSNGNYTQAELTLTNAIVDGGGVELYTALSSLYVEQDKLLDAAKMLDAVCSDSSTVDPVVREELMNMRPAAPTVSHEPGFYSQYITVTLTCTSGKLLTSCNGQYPSNESTQTDPAQNITLAEGENLIYAMAVSEEGLVSPLGSYFFTIGGVVEQVEISDPAIEDEIRKLLNVVDTTPIYTNDLWKITEFTVPESATQLGDLKYLIRLQKLTISSAPSMQLAFISSMPDLVELSITDTSVQADELALIGALPKLELLTLSNCGLSTTSGLEKAVNLTYLDLQHNTIRNITALSSIPNLQTLYLQYNAVSDLSALSGMKNLQTLDISFNTLSDCNPIRSVQSLKSLNLSNNSITDVSPIAAIPGITTLNLDSNLITDVAPLADCTQLISLVISNNSITNIEALSTLVSLSHFDFNHNQVTALPAWDNNSQLVTIDGSHNLIEDLEPLRGLNKLNKVSMDYNPELKSITCLTSCHHLIQVNVYGTKVTEIKPLLDMSVIVNYDPTT